MRKGIVGLIVVVVIVVIAAGAYVATLSPAPKPTPTPTTTTTPTPTTTTTTTPQKQLKVAWVCDTPTAFSHGWELSQYESLLRMKTKYNYIFEFTEGVSYPDGDRVGRSYVDRGYNVILYSSWYPDAIRAVARDYPNVTVLGAGGGTELNVLYPPPAKVPPNVGHYDSYLHESAYLNGYLAGKMTKTNIIGMVGQYPVNNANRYYNGFIQGAKDANENVKIKMTWLFTWFDPPKAKEAAISLIEIGADIIYSDAGGSIQGAESKGVLFITTTLERPDITAAPSVLLSSNNWIEDPAFDLIISGAINGNFEAREYYYGMRDGGSVFKIHLPDKVPSDVMSQVNELKSRIMAGTLVIEPIIAQPDTYWKL